MNKDFLQQATALLEGAYDLHVHTALDYRPRSVEEIELLRQAEQLRMAGVLVKNHYEPTQARAYLANRYADTQAVAYGSITLNATVGGLNPFAVENALRQGAKMVWMPTMDSALCVALGGVGQAFENRRGISIYQEDDRLDPAVYEIIDLVKQYDACIATGHLDAREALAFCRLSLERGAQTVLTHPDWKRSRLPLDTQIEMANRGALIEKVFWYLPAREICESARKIGVERTFVVTDRGQVDQETPAQALLHFVEAMLECEMTEAEIRSLICAVPRRILFH